MSRYFFIFALPRSRTAWLANWLTVGDCLCLHEFGVVAGTGLMAFTAALPYARVGMSEPCPLVSEYIPENLLHTSPVLTVNMAPEESHRRCVEAWPHLVPAQEMADASLSTLRDWYMRLRHLSELPNCMTVNEQKLGNIDVLRTIWRHLMPTPFDNLRTQMLVELGVCVRYAYPQEAIDNKSAIINQYTQEGGIGDMLWA